MDGHQDEMELRPTAGSRAAFDWLGSFGDRETERSVSRMADQVRRIVPECVALSLTVSDGALTFTLMGDRPGAALLDAMQYLDGGPCVETVETGQVENTSDLPMDEGRWQFFARAQALTGISSTLSLPVLADGRVVASVNLYASTSDAFDGHHTELAEATGAWAEGAVTNADLGFSSRVRAAATPRRLRARGTVNVAAGLVAAYQDIDVEDAVEKIRDAASRAGVDEPDLAQFLLDAHAQQG